MTVDYIRIDVDILRQPGLSDKAKMLLGLVRSFNGNGLSMGNSGLADLLCTSSKHITRLLAEIKDHIRVENAQSKYRKIFYSRENEGVEGSPLPQKGVSSENLLPHIGELLPQKCVHTSASTQHIRTKVTEKTKNTHAIEQIVFEEARKNYPGTKRGLETEFQNFIKKHRDWQAVLPLLKSAIERQQKFIWANTEKRYIPHFVTWLNQRQWEIECSGPGIMTTPFDHAAARQRQEALAGFGG